MNKTGDYFIMLIDDNEIDCFINSKIIDKSGVAAKTMVLNSPLQALDYLRKEINTSENIPDIILLDIYMPQMSGFEFLDEFDKFSTEIAKDKCRFFLLSSTLDPRDLSRAAENKYVARILNKPLSMQDLQAL